MKKTFLIVLFFVLATLPAMAGEQLIEANSKFTYKGKPIHPFLIEQFSNWYSDYRPPMTKTVDVSAAFDTNKYQLDEIKENEYWVFSENIEYDDEFRLYNSFHYRWLGRMGNDIHVLETGGSGGGSGFFMDLIFVRFSEETIMREGKQVEQLLMTIVGTYSLGDRYDGEIKVYANKVVIPASKQQFGGGALDKQVELKISSIK